MIYEYKVPEDVIALKSFVLRLGSYRAIISLNIKKAMYQTSYIISKEHEKIDDVKEVYLEKTRESVNENLPIGFQDIVNSVESGDII